MSNARIGDIKMFGGNFAPRNWAFCNGQLLSIAQNTALFSILGTTYGGNGQTNFALPNLQGRVPMHWGSGAGLSQRSLGQTGGLESIALTSAQLPIHNHVVLASTGAANSSNPSGNIAAVTDAGNAFAAPSAANTTMASAQVSTAGGSQPFDNTQPYLALTFIICLFGVFPSRN